MTWPDELRQKARDHRARESAARKATPFPVEDTREALCAALAAEGVVHGRMSGRRVTVGEMAQRVPVPELRKMLHDLRVLAAMEADHG